MSTPNNQPLIDDEPLRTLGHVPDLSTPPLEHVHRRASAIRAARRRTRAGLSAGALASALALGGVLLPLGDNDGGGTGSQAASFLGIAPAQAADPAACISGTGFTTRFTRQEWTTDPKVGALASWLPAEATGLPVRGVDVTSDLDSCAPVVPAAVLYTRAPTVKGLTLWSDVAPPFSGSHGLEDVNVHGASGKLLHLPGSLMISWVADDGTRWIAQGSGLDQSAILATIDGLALDGTTVIDTSVPASWEQAALPSTTTDPAVVRWQVQYGLPGDGSDDPGIRLSVGRETEPVATQAARGSDTLTFTQVHDDVAIYYADQGGCLNWDTAGLAYQICGSPDITTLVALAEQVTRITPQDPRAQTAPELYPPESND